MIGMGLVVKMRWSCSYTRCILEMQSRLLTVCFALELDQQKDCLSLLVSDC